MTSAKSESQNGRFEIPLWPATSLGFGAPLDLGLALEREAITHVFASEDTGESIQAFTDKRQPHFKGR